MTNLDYENPDAIAPQHDGASISIYQSRQGTHTDGHDTIQLQQDGMYWGPTNTVYVEYDQIPDLIKALQDIHAKHIET